MAHPYKDKIPGQAVVQKRYGGTGSAVMTDECKCERPQSPEDKQAPGYDNDVPSNWLRGMGPGEATGKPGFDKTRLG